MKSGFTFLMLLLFAAVIKIPAQTWNGSVSNDWNNAANWTPAMVPGMSGNVTINNAGATHQPTLSNDVSIASLNMSGGILNLNGFILDCSGAASLTGDSLVNGTIIANNFSDVTNMHIGGKLTLQKNGAANGFWSGNNKVYGDSLIIIWSAGTLHFQTVNPDSILTNLKIKLADASAVAFSENASLYVQNNLIIDNAGNGIFSGGNHQTIIGGNLVGMNFSIATPNLILKNIITLGNNPNGPFYTYNASISACSFNGNFTLVADSAVALSVTNSSILGTQNLLQAGTLSVHDNVFGKMGMGNTILRATHHEAANVYMRDGNNKFLGNAQYETDATVPGGLTLQHTYFGQDSCMGNLTFILKGNSALSTNAAGHSYVAGNLVIDAQGASKTIHFAGPGETTFSVAGNFTAKNFTKSPIPGVAFTEIVLQHLYVQGTDTCGTFYCYTGNINSCGFNGNFKLIGDSSQTYSITYTDLLGADNFFQSGSLDFHHNHFGKAGAGTTVLKAAHNVAGNVYMRGGRNKFFNNVQWETFSVPPGGTTIQQNYYGTDTVLGNLNFILKGNSSLITNEVGYNYVAGNLTIDGQGARPWIQFTGGPTNVFTVGGNFVAKNFSPYLNASGVLTNVYLRNLYVSGTDTCGTFYCYTGDISNCILNGNIKVIGDSSQTYTIFNSSFRGADNLFQSGSLDFHFNDFGKKGSGTTLLRAAHNLAANVYMRGGGNIFYNNVQWETYSVPPGGITIQQNYYSADSVYGNLNFILKGNSSLVTNASGDNYVGGNLIIDGQGARPWVEFTGGAGNTFKVVGNFVAKNFSPNLNASGVLTNVHLRNLTVTGTDTCGTFYCYSGDISNCSFNGNFKLFGDSAQTYSISNSSFLGADNLFQSGSLNFHNNLFGKANSGATVLRAIHNVAGNVYLRDGDNKFLNDIRLDGHTNTGVLIMQQNYYGDDTCMGNYTVNLSGVSGLNILGNLYLAKGLTINNNGSGGVSQTSSATAIHFFGSEPGDYSANGSGSAPSFINIDVNKQGSLHLLSPLAFTGTTTFNRGVVFSSSTSPLVVVNAANVTGAWDSSYTDGPVNKIGNSAFTFPVGQNYLYAPVSITAPSATTDGFTAQYFNHVAHKDGYDSTMHDVSLNHLSRHEYWTVNRTAGASPVKVTLSWNAKRSGGVDAINDLRVARWNGSIWKDEGSGLITGANEEGTIQSLNNITQFSPFTLASSSINNPLPVVYVYFYAALKTGNTVELNWLTAQEKNNAFFEIRKSMDAGTWTVIGTVKANSTHLYSFTDKLPVNGNNFYQIRQVDQNGTYSYTSVRLVRVNVKNRLFIWPNPAHDNLTVQIPFKKATMEIYDVNGNLIWTTVTANMVNTIPVPGLPSGTYILQVKSDGNLLREKFTKQ